MNFAVYFRDPPEDGDATLLLNGREFVSKIVVDGWYQFAGVSLERGDLSLRSYTDPNEPGQQAWQIEISKPKKYR